jgi:hypothetical protein
LDLAFPGVESEADFTRLGPDYRSLLRAVREAGDEAERCLAELALAIFLLGCNYELSPVDYQRLLVLPPGAQDHLGYLPDDPGGNSGK